MIKPLLKATIAALLPTVVIACGGGHVTYSSDHYHPNENNTGPYYATGTDELAGLYDVSIDTEEGFDEYYLHLDEFGNGTIYDYAGDSYDDYGNCYWIIPDSLQVYHLFDTYFDTGTDTPIFEAEMVNSGFKAIFDEHPDDLTIENYYYAEGINIHDMEIAECSTYFSKQAKESTKGSTKESTKGSTKGSTKESTEDNTDSKKPIKERKVFGKKIKTN